MKNRRIRQWLIPAILCSFFLTTLGCNSSSTEYYQEHLSGTKPVSAEALKSFLPVVGETIYVPAYSHVYHKDRRVIYLTTTLSVHNTDPDNSILVKKIDYYNSAGQLLRHCLDSPKRLLPLATMEYVIAEKDTSGGFGANFMVDWAADKKVNEPIVEAVMIGTAGQQGISFLSTGRVVQKMGK